MVIRLRPDLAPKHVERVKMLAKEGFYNGLKWHRVIPGFMAQTGDPQGTGAGGSKYPDLPAEFSPTPFERGTIGAARTSDPNSANSQFFICFTHTPNLNGQYTVWGQVTEGMQFVDQIAKGEPPPKPDVIVKMYLAADCAVARQSARGRRQSKVGGRLAILIHCPSLLPRAGCRLPHSGVPNGRNKRP